MEVKNHAFPKQKIFQPAGFWQKMAKVFKNRV
jgi:hypothetical protein